MVNPQAMFWLWPSATPGSAGLARADYVPSRRNQVHHVAQRRLGDHAVRIIGQQRLARPRQLSGDRPVVAAFGGCVGNSMRVSLPTRLCSKAEEKSGQVRARRQLQLHRRIEIEKQTMPRPLPTAVTALRMLQFVECVAGHGERRHAVQAVVPASRVPA